MRFLERKILPYVLAIVVILSTLPLQGICGGGNVVIGESGAIPGGGIPGDGGIVGIKTPGFAISIGEETFTGPDVLKSEDTAEQIRVKFINHFKNKFPNQESSIFFIPKVNFEPNSALGWYDASSGSLRYRKNEDAKERLRQLRPLEKTLNENLNYTKLFDFLKDPSHKISDLSGGKWQSLVVQDESKALMVWGYLLQGNADSLNERMSIYLKTRPGDLIGSTENQKRQAAACWVDLMATLWVLMPTDYKGVYYDEIERYLKRTPDILSHPPMISVTTVVRVSAPNFYNKPIYIKSADYAQYLYQGTPGCSVYRSDWHVGAYDIDYTKYMGKQPGWRKLFEDAAIKSRVEAPERKRTTDLSGNAAISDAFNYGMGAVFSKRMHTYDGYVTWSDSSAVGAIEALIFKDKLYGFVIAYPGLLGCKLEPSGRFGIRTDAPEKEIVEPRSAVINDKVRVQLDISQQGQELSDWQNVLSDDSTFDQNYPQIQINLTRKEPTVRLADTTTPAGTATNPYLNTSSQFKGNGVPRSIDKKILRQMLESKDKLIIYEDDTTNYPIAEGQELKFTYNASVTILLSATESVVLRADPGDAIKKYGRGIMPPPDIVSYTSEPSYWSEIKNGSPGNETFEAMAGVPTTRNLYFASGGSEFIVQVELKYVKDAVTTRTYRSYFTGGVESEFKAGDTCPTKQLGGQDVDMHNGGTYSRAWTGKIPNKAEAVTNLHSASCPAQPDYTAYNADLVAAKDFAKSVNDTQLSFQSKSDIKLRKKIGWNATIDPQPSPPRDTSASLGCSYVPATKTSSGTPCGNEMATAYPAPDGSYTITVTWTVPAHIICGPQCCRVLPQIEDTWTQKIVHDHMKINVAKIWKLDKASVNGMRDITGTDEFKATVVSGDPNIFFNIADLGDPENDGNDSAHGRIRYSIEPNMHDTVVWNEGPRSNKDDGIVSQRANVDHVEGNGHQNLPWATGILYNNNSKGVVANYPNEENYHRDRGGLNTGTSDFADSQDVKTMEWQRFNQRRITQNIATVISDMLILQTSSGDQSIMYFQKDSVPTECQKNFPKVAATRQEMWDDNPLSFAKMKPDAINIGSYNGKFYTPLAKYSSYISSPVVTKFDTVPAGKIRLPRPSTAMRLVNTELDIIDTNTNGFYATGKSLVFYKNILNYGTAANTYDIESSSKFGDVGAEFGSTYSDNHSKINDIVIHNPVSTEFSMVVPLSSSRDQRTDSSKALGGNLQGPSMETVKRLKNPLPRQNLIWNGDAEKVNTDGGISNWKTWESSSGKANFSRRTTADWKIDGIGSFEIITQPNANYSGVYYAEISGIPGDSYTFTGKLSAHRCKGYFSIRAQNSVGLDIGWYNSSIVNNNAVPQDLSINFKAPAGTVKLTVQIVNGDTSGYVPGYSEYVFADNLVLYDNTTTTWQPMSYTIDESTSIPNPDYATPYSIPNPDYIPAVSQSAHSFTSGYWTAPVNCVIDVSTYGQGQGAWDHSGHGYYYSYSAYGSGKVDVVKGDIITISGKSVLKNGIAIIRGNDSSLSGYYDATSCNEAERLARANDAAITTGSGLYSLVTSPTGTSQTLFTVPALSIPAIGSPTIMVNNAHYIPAVNKPRVAQSFSYIGSVQTFIVPSKGVYLFEVWGAQGADGYTGNGGSNTRVFGGKGGYSSGSLELEAGTVLNVYVGGEPTYYNSVPIVEGWNGGGRGNGETGAWGGGGGGASDIRIGGASLSSRVIVAGGGGGGGHTQYGGYGGGFSGGVGTGGRNPGTQSSGYSLGIGESTNGHDMGAGGGGYYGGYGSTYSDSSGSGGSGYIGGVNSGVLKCGNESMPTISGGTQIGQSGNGYIRVTTPSIVTPAVGIPWIEGLSPTH